MRTEDTIQVGDKVNINFEHCQGLYNVEVVSLPSLMHEPWIVKNSFGHITYVLSYTKIEKVPLENDEW